MKLGIFLSSGDSFANMAKVGQDTRFKSLYLTTFAKKFNQVYIFTYKDEEVEGLPANITVVPNRLKFHRFIYGFLMPFLNYHEVKECDVIRVYHLLGTLPAILTKIFFRKPFVFNFAYDYVQFANLEKKSMQVIFIKLLMPFALFFASKIIAANTIVYKKIGRQKAIFIPNGINVAIFKKNKKTNKIPLLLNVGRLEIQKNQLNIIKACFSLPVKLLIIGNGSYKNKLLHAAKEFKVNLKIIEKVDNSKMPEIYQKADIFLLPSLIEGSPKALLEAMASGLPVIGSKVEGINEIIQDGKNGLLCKVDSESIRSTIMKLIDDPVLRKKISRVAREYVNKYYDLDLLLQKETKLLINTGKGKYD
jgi:glycosyltransferase involved in cell wall biosynthesis